MNRCHAYSYSAATRALVALACCAAMAAQAQHLTEGGRTFPADVERGEFTVLQGNQVQLGKQREQLAPGARIFNLHNRVQLPVTLAGQTQAVNYRRNATGQIAEVWLLTPQEAKAPLRKSAHQRKAFPSLAERQRMVNAINSQAESGDTPDTTIEK